MTKGNIDWIRLRYITALLGEYYHWWPANILTGKGEDFLAYVLPKTKSLASQQLALEICRMDHDKQIGPNKFHLFRLPQKWEEQIFAELSNDSHPKEVPAQNELLTELFKLSQNLSISIKKGPALIGLHTELNDESVFNAFAKYYYEAFTNDFRTYPYLN
jgi:hypothetical protein